MPCTNCNNQPISFTYSYPRGCGGSSSSSNCDCTYTGNNLACSGILKNDSLNTALEKIDAQICSIAGDYSSYNFNCLTTWLGSDITTEAEFVDAVTDYVCEIRTDLDTFTDTTFTTYQDLVDVRISEIEIPEITCAAAGVTSVDSLQTVFNKYCTLFGTIDTALDISSVDWDQCFTVSVPPTTIAGGFDLLIDQICSLKADVSPLPTFDNTGNCLDGTATDSLVTTIDEIITRLCVTPLWNDGEDDVAYGCVPKVYTGGGANLLQNVVNNILAATSDLLENKVVTWSADFVVEQVDPEDECAGLSVSLATPINIDRNVAVDATDNTPGELIDKLAEGDNISIAVIGSNPNKQIEISATIDHKVLASNVDDTPGFLVDKVNGDTDEGVTLTPTYNPSTKKVDFNLNVDLDTLVENILTKISGDSTLRGIFCSIVNTCIPQGCAQYTVTNNTESTQQMLYTGCDGMSVGPLFLSASNSITFCAQLNSVIAPECNIVNDGECTTTSTTTQAPLNYNLVCLNNSTDIVISDVTFNGDSLALTYPFETGDSQFFTDYPTGYFTVIVTVSSASTGQYIAFTDAMGTIQTVNVDGAGTYLFTSPVYINNLVISNFSVLAYP